MNYFNNHRRKLIKKKYIRGTKDTVQGVQKLELENTVNLPPCKLEICGNTRQGLSPTVNEPQPIENVCDISLTARGVNLMNLSDEHITVSDYYYKTIKTMAILKPNTAYTLSFDYEFDIREDNGKETRVDLFHALSSGAGMVRICGQDFPNYEKGTFVASFTTSADIGDERYLFLRIPAADVKQTIEMHASNFMLCFDLEKNEYEPYIEPISIHVPGILESENLLNLKAFVNQTDTASLNEDESVFTININGTYAFNGLLRDFCPSIKVGDNVTLKFTTTSYEKSIVLEGSDIEWKSGQTITVTEDILMSSLLFLCFSGEGNPTEYYNLRIVNADFEKELKFAKYDNYQDSLIIDKHQEKVIYNQVLDRITISNEKFRGLFWSNGYVGIRADDVLPCICEYQKGYCTHAPSMNLDASCDYNGVWIGKKDDTIYWSGIISLLGYDSEWADKENPTDSERSNAQMSFMNWLSEHEANGHHFECVYVLPTPIEHDITDTRLGQKLLNLALPELENVIVEISSDLSPSKISAEYYSKTKEDKHKITVNYEDISGMQIKNSDEHFVRRDSLCKIISPNIDGYEPESESITVYAGNDTEITLIYNKK